MTPLGMVRVRATHCRTFPDHMHFAITPRAPEISILRLCVSNAFKIASVKRAGCSFPETLRSMDSGRSLRPGAFDGYVTLENSSERSAELKNRPIYMRISCAPANLMNLAATCTTLQNPTFWSTTAVSTCRISRTFCPLFLRPLVRPPALSTILLTKANF